MNQSRTQEHSLKNQNTKKCAQINQVVTMIQIIKNSGV